MRVIKIRFGKFGKVDFITPTLMEILGLLLILVFLAYVLGTL